MYMFLKDVSVYSSTNCLSCFSDNIDQTPKHMNIEQYIACNVPSLKEFYEPSSKSPKGSSALKALSSVMLLLQRFALS
jgi:hypothetical protein